MAQLIDGDGRGLHRGLIGNTPGLPPRFPIIPHRGVVLSDLDTVLQGYYGSSGSTGRSYRHLTGMPSHSPVVQDRPFLCAKVEDSSVSTNRKALPQRSAIDSLTQSEVYGSLCMLSNNVGEGETACEASETPEKADNEVKEDDDQLTDLLEEIQQLHNQQYLPISARSQALHLDLDSQIVNKVGNVRASLEIAPGHQIPELAGITSKDPEFCLQDSTNGDPLSLAELHGNDLDPKRAKRVLANRQSAQRSRVRKLQYIAELERIVGTLEIEVSTLSLQVVYLKHQRALLNMDNNALKQQAIFFVQEKRNKDSQNEILKHDIRRLKKLSEFQSLNKTLEMPKQQQPQHRHIQRHSSLPTDFIAKTYQLGDQNMDSRLTKMESSSADGLTTLMRDFGGMSLDAALSQEKLHRTIHCMGAGAASTMELNRIVSGESSNGGVIANDMLSY